MSTETYPVAVVGPAQLARELEGEGLEVQRAASVDELLGQQLTEHGRAIVLSESLLSRGRASKVVQRVRKQLPLTDVLAWLPGKDPEMVRAVLLAGGRDVILDGEIETLAQRLREVVSTQVFLPQVQSLRRARRRSSRFEGLVSRSEAMWDLFDLCVRVASTDATVLILGETGTGKELLARAIHRRSPRRGRFVAVNCAAIPEGLVDAELFGHEKGTFTGAVHSREGLFRHAEGGTLFLDEIGDIPLPAQFSLLRALQEGRIRPVGSHEEVPVDVRVVAATSIPLEEWVAKGKFREDLFYRLDVIRMVIPPLRDRPEDLVYLFNHFAKQFSKLYNLERPQVTQEFLDALLEHPWEGNVRQLENFTERLVLMRIPEALRARHFLEVLRPYRARGTGGQESGRPPPRAPKATLEDEVRLDRPLADTVEEATERIESSYLDAALRENRGRIGETAEQAGMSRRTLLRKMKAYGLDKAVYKTEASP